jgi:polyhydroxybutyrate depolymerase
VRAVVIGGASGTRHAGVAALVVIAAALVALGVFAASMPAAAAPAVTTSPGTHEFSLEHEGRKRPYLLHVPSRLDPSKPVPVVLALHGGGGTMHHQADDQRYGLVTKAESAGFAVVFPNGNGAMGTAQFATWNAGGCCGVSVRRNIDDVGFLRAVIDDVKRRLLVDPERVYSIGMSNGAMMSYRLACEMPETIRGVMAVAGTDNAPACTPARGVSILHVHAVDDDHVPFGGGRGPATLDSAVSHTAVPATIDKWVKLNACNPQPQRVMAVSGAYCDRYSGCKDGARVQLCVTERGAHSWPGGGVNVRAKEPPSKAIVANDVMWDFFERR